MTEFQIAISLTMPGDDAEDNLEDLREKIGVMFTSEPTWKAHVDIVERTPMDWEKANA